MSDSKIPASYLPASAHGVTAYCKSSGQVGLSFQTDTGVVRLAIDKESAVFYCNALRTMLLTHGNIPHPSISADIPDSDGLSLEEHQAILTASEAGDIAEVKHIVESKGWEWNDEPGFVPAAKLEALGFSWNGHEWVQSAQIQ